MSGRTEPEHHCALCPRLVDFRSENTQKWPQWFNGPVPSFGDLDARFLCVGLAPGLRGANCTGRPFTGDYAGDLLYPSLKRLGLAEGDYQARPDDGFRLISTRITNAVRCVPPANKPLPAEFSACLDFLRHEIQAMPNLTALFAIGRDAHQAILGTFDERKSQFPFAHGAKHRLSNGLWLVDSYHCSRYNTNTGRLTEDMFLAALTTLIALA